MSIVIQVVKNVNILYKWLKMSIVYTSGYQCQYFIQVVTHVNILYKWLKMSIVYTSG
jgi:hypothetical protein